MREAQMKKTIDEILALCERNPSHKLVDEIHEIILNNRIPLITAREAQEASRKAADDAMKSVLRLRTWGEV